MIEYLTDLLKQHGGCIKCVVETRGSVHHTAELVAVDKTGVVVYPWADVSTDRYAIPWHDIQHIRIEEN